MKTLKIEYKLEIYPRDFGKDYGWKKAKKKCKKLGKEWRLPTKEELDIMYRNKDIIGNFFDSAYWSSTESDPLKAWFQYFDDGFQEFYDKDYYCSFRPVRTIR
jgi:hypothetical protein